MWVSYLQQSLFTHELSYLKQSSSNNKIDIKIIFIMTMIFEIYGVCIFNCQPQYQSNQINELPRNKLTGYLRHFFTKHNFSVFCWKYHVIHSTLLSKLQGIRPAGIKPIYKNTAEMWKNAYLSLNAKKFWMTLLSISKL